MCPALFSETLFGVILLSLTSLAAAPDTLPVLSTRGAMSLVPFFSPFSESQRLGRIFFFVFFFWFYHVTKCATTTPSLDNLFSALVITHSAVAAGSRQRRADNACALDQSHSAASGDAPSASSSHPLFGNRSAAERRNTPGEAKGKRSTAYRS